MPHNKNCMLCGFNVSPWQYSIFLKNTLASLLYFCFSEHINRILKGTHSYCLKEGRKQSCFKPMFLAHAVRGTEVRKEVSYWLELQLAVESKNVRPRHSLLLYFSTIYAEFCSYFSWALPWQGKPTLSGFLGTCNFMAVENNSSLLLLHWLKKKE